MRRLAAAVAAISLIAGIAQVQAQGQGRGNDRGGGLSDLLERRAPFGHTQDA